MVRTDTLHLQIPTWTVKTARTEDRFSYKPTTKNGQITSQFWESKHAQDYHSTGINRVRLFPQAVIVELSAKALKGDYLEGISINNIEQVFSEINKTGVIEFDTHLAIENAAVTICHITNNIDISETGESIETVRDIVSLSSIAAGSTPKQIGNSVIWKNGKQYVTCYDKQKELSRKNRGNESFKSEIGADKFENIIRKSKGIYRMESKLISHQIIRDLCNIRTTGPVLLTDILTSTENVNLALFEKLTKRNLSQNEYFSDLDSCGGDLKTHQKVLQYEWIIDSCGGDSEAIALFIKLQGRKYQWNKKYQYRFKSAVIQHLQKKLKSNYGISSIVEHPVITHIKNKLAA